MPRKKNEIGGLERVPPHSIEAEKALLGCMLLEEEARMKAFEALTADSFYHQPHRNIFAAVARLFERQSGCDLVTLTHQLRQEGLLDEAGGPEYLTAIADSIPTAAHAEEYIKIVREKQLLRTLIATATRIITEASGDPEEVEPLLDRAESLIFEVSENRAKQAIHRMGDLVHQTMDFFEKIHHGETSISGMPTGFKDLDEMTFGFQPADLIIVASRPSMGKTALACNIAMNMAGMKQFPILIFSLEMSKEQLVQRMLCNEARVNPKNIKHGFLTDANFGKLTQAAGRLSETRIFIDDSPALTIFEVRARARRMKAREDIQLVIVDYLQLMRGRGRVENRQQEISEISASLKALAKELAVPVIAVSQLSRAPEQRGENKRPQLSDLRESGSIEQDADLVLLLYRDDYYDPDNPDVKGKAEVIIAKQRNGPTGMIPLTFIREFTRFENFSQR